MWVSNLQPRKETCWLASSLYGIWVPIPRKTMLANPEPYEEILTDKLRTLTETVGWKAMNFHKPYTGCWLAKHNLMRFCKN